MRKNKDLTLFGDKKLMKNLDEGMTKYHFKDRIQFVSEAVEFYLKYYDIKDKNVNLKDEKKEVIIDLKEQILEKDAQVKQLQRDIKREERSSRLLLEDALTLEERLQEIENILYKKNQELESIILTEDIDEHYDVNEVEELEAMLKLSEVILIEKETKIHLLKQSLYKIKQVTDAEIAQKRSDVEGTEQMGLLIEVNNITRQVDDDSPKKVYSTKLG